MRLLGPTRRWSVKLEGRVFDEWTRVEVSRDLEDLAGKFTLELRDAARGWASWPFATLAGMTRLVEAGLEIEISLDGRPLLSGWVNKLSPHAAEGQVSVTISGCDKTADLCDCAANVDGPSEYYGLTIDKVAQKICTPYGLKATAEAEVGRPFDRYAIDVGETALSAIEKGARQRGLLVTSDGRDGVVLTQSGTRRGADLIFPGNVIESGGEFKADGRWSEYHVKGQAERAGGRRRKAPRLSAKRAPAVPTPAEHAKWLKQQQAHEAGGTAVYGRAKEDGATKRHRPLVVMGRTQLTDEGASTQADWMARTARGRCESLDYVVLDYYGPDERLWLPNTLASVEDRYQQVFREMLIAGVSYTYDEQDGSRTHLRLSGPDAYDTKDVCGHRKNKAGAKKGSKGSSGGLDGTAAPLTV